MAKVNYSFSQDFLYYEGYEGFVIPMNNEQQNSGAYVFRPKGNKTTAVDSFPWVSLQVFRVRSLLLLGQKSARDDFSDSLRQILD